MSFEAGREVLERLREQGFPAAEVYFKRGRSRRFRWSRDGAVEGPATAAGAATAGPAGAAPAPDTATETTLAAEEAGWSVRAGAGRSSFFFAATGPPRPLDRWPAAIEGDRLELPRPAAVEDWSEPGELAEPLLSEEEGWRLLRRLGDDLSRRLPGAGLEATLEDGASEVRIWNHHGLDAGHRGRFASLRVEARAPSSSSGTSAATLLLAERSARRLALDGVADRMADLVAVRGVGSIGDGDGRDMVLAPEVAARLLAPIASAFVDRPRETLAALFELRDDDHVGSAALTLIDDGRFTRGLVPAPVDGEGLPAGRRVLIDRGRLADTVLPWERSGVALGSRARSSWRDPPRVALSQCWVAPDDAVTPASLVGDLTDGFYLLDAGVGGSYDLAAGFFSLPVFGFRIASGRPLHPLGAASLVGDPRRLLHAVCGLAADLRFDPLDARIGAPSLLVRGLSLRPARNG